MNDKHIRDSLRSEWLKKYENKSKAVFSYDQSGQLRGRAQNGWASTFWAGFDKMVWGVRVPSKSDISYGIYLAGQDAKQRDQV